MWRLLWLNETRCTSGCVRRSRTCFRGKRIAFYLLVWWNSSPVTSVLVSCTTRSRWDIRNAHFGPLDASRGQTKQTMVGIKVDYGISEQVGRVQQAQK